MKTPELLTRDNFREGVFKRDNYKCVFCDKEAKDAHHILERRLFTNGGYFIDNGASVCHLHHMECEMTKISVEEVREAAKISSIVIPDHFYSDTVYDKWGNVVLPSGMRLKGELFNDESVQKVLKLGGVLDSFTSYVKYPRTHHLPWSLGVNSDDRVLSSLDAFEGKRVIVSTKMDGENTSMYSDYFHARSIDGRNHPSRAWAKGFWSRICGDIPEGWRVCGENLYAKHSIHYENLETYFMGFSIWDSRNICLSWDSTVEWFELMNIPMVPVIYDGIFDQKKIESLWSRKDWDTMEGYVVRVADEISYGDFKTKVGKFVRNGHVQTAKHWMAGSKIEKNLLKE